MDCVRGIIFDIQRGSMYDGPGIRTTVFTKGCPLRCKWCHNPESQNPKLELAYWEEKCVGCKKCSEVCTMGAHLFSDIHIFDRKQCIMCGKCVHVCPTNAMKSYGYTISAEEAMTIIRKDKAYYDLTNGGLTLSGGEPFLQNDFSFSLLSLAKQEKIHTCVETCGFASHEIILQSLKYVDYYLFDYKLDDCVKHQYYTGVSNTIIQKNFDCLYTHHARIKIRCPIIPGVNDTLEHFSSIHQLEVKYPEIEGIEILPYHNFGSGKAKALGREYGILSETAGNEIKQKWKELMSISGCSEAIINSF